MSERALDMKVAIKGHNGDQQALLEALNEADIAAEVADDLRVWANGSGPRAVVMAVDTADEMEAIIDLRDSNWDLVVVTLTRDDSQATYRSALRAGATASAPADAPMDHIVEVVREALHGRSILPADVARRLALDAPDQPSDYAPRLDEIGWIQAMASGDTMAEIAESAGVTKSELSKRLNELYRRIGVENRTEAIIKFARWGLLD